MASVEANGITIEYEVYGKGEPLLLVMGLGGQLTDWGPETIEAFAGRGFKVIAFDNRDIGLSTEFDWEPPTQAQSLRNLVLRRKPDAGYHIEDMANDAAGLLDALAIDSAHVVGMSMGGMISQSLTINHPQRVRSLTSIMSNTGDGRNGRPSKRLIAAVARMGQPEPENLLDHSVRMFEMLSGPHFDAERHRERTIESFNRSFRPQGIGRQTAAIAASPDRTEALRSVTQPTLVIHGLRDRLVTKSGGIATARAVPHSRLLMFPDMAHDLPLPRIDEIVDAIAHNAARATATARS